MRKSEILNLKLSNVDFEQQIIYVKDTKNENPREIPMNNFLTETLTDVKFKSEFVFSKNNGVLFRNVRRDLKGH